MSTVEVHNGVFERDQDADDKGTFSWDGGQTTYVGDVAGVTIEGHGEFTWNKGHESYAGQVANGLRHGQGVQQQGLDAKEDSARSSAGDVVHLRRDDVHNHASKNDEKFRRYEGEWTMGVRHGKGRLEYTKDGSSFYEGDWSEGRRHGRGTMQYSASGPRYDGDWVHDTKHGNGTIWWPKLCSRYEGQWESDQPHGKGEQVWWPNAAAMRLPGGMSETPRTTGELQGEDASANAHAPPEAPCASWL